MKQIKQLAGPVRLHPVNNRRYSIERKTLNGWEATSFAVSTHEADKLIAQKMAANGGRWRAMEIAQ